MKTRKVGKIVSLLVAIVLVATIMIPAASVLADTGSNAVSSGVDWTGTDVKVIDGDNAYGDLDAYLASLTPNSDKVYNIRLDADVVLPKFGAYTDNEGTKASDNGSDAAYYALASYGIFKDAYKKKAGKLSWNQGDNPKFGINEILGKTDSGSTFGADYNTLNATPSISTNPYKTVFNVAKSGDKTTRAFLNYDLQCVGKYVGRDDLYKPLLEANRDRFEELDTVQKMLMAGAAGNEKLGASTGDTVDATKLTEYDDAMLCVKEGVKVCINLNGHKVSGLNSNENPFTGNPSYQTSIFVVRGELTVVDEHTTNAGEAVGMITGGSGSIYGKTQIGGIDNYYIQDSPLYQGVAYFGVGLGDNASDPDKWGDAYVIKKGETAPDGNKWEGTTWDHNVGNYRIYTYYFQRYYSSVKEAHGGGVYVAPGATFTLMSGKISENAAWRVAGSSTKIFDNSRNPVACGGGVYVDEKATFNMLGGEVSHNAVRAYQKTTDLEPYAMGGGVYLASGATMNFKGGKVADNGTYAESNKNTNQTSRGGGIYVAGGATLNMMGNLSRDQEKDNIEDLLSGFPQVTGNGAGVYVRTKGRTGYAEGAGVYVAANGSFNVKNAVISANDFCEFSRYADEGSGFDNTTVPAGWLITSVKRDPDTGLAEYGKEPTNKGELQTQQILHENSGKFGVGMAYTGGSKIYTNGAGVCVADSSSRLVVGSRTWIYDNWDLVTNNHKAFSNTRYNERKWDVNKQEYVYDKDLGFDKNNMATREKEDPNPNHKYCVGDGYCWSDTRDDIYLPDGVTLSVGESLFECKVGINYYDMIGNGAASKNESELGKESNRVFATSSDTLDYNVWGTTSASPRPRDIQYFYLNDNNKTYEYKEYSMPAKAVAKYAGISHGLRDGKNGPEVNVANVSDTKVGKIPFEGYVDYNQKYDAGRWKWAISALTGPWYDYDKETYPRVETSSKNPMFPQVAKELANDANASLASNRAKYMDYKVIWDNDDITGFATTSEKPVLRFGEVRDRKMYVTVDFAESNKSYFGLGGSDLNLNDSNLKADVDKFSSTRTDYATVNQMTFNTGSGFKAKLTLGIPVPDYKLYKAQKLSGFTPDKPDTLSRDKKGNEDEDLYFKNWSFYTSYGYGPEICTPDSIKGKSAAEIYNMTKYKTVNGNKEFMKTRGTFEIDLAKINNTNLNAQPCPSLTAMWYTKEELAEARRRISGVKSQIAVLDDGTVVLRAIAVVGKEYAEYERAGFVVSTENPTPTVEGSYDYSVKGKIYKRILVNNEKGKSWVYAYNLASDLSFENGQDGKCGIVYTNFKIADSLGKLTPEAKNQIYFVTPYVYDEDTQTYYYGKSRAISYAYLEQKDAEMLQRATD